MFLAPVVMVTIIVGVSAKVVQSLTESFSPPRSENLDTFDWNDEDWDNCNQEPENPYAE